MLSFLKTWFGGKKSLLKASVCEAYGVWKQKSLYGRKFMGIERTTFLIGPDPRIQKIFTKVKVKGHAAAVM